MRAFKSQKVLVDALKKVQVGICAYRSASFCDCKYGAQNAGKATESGNGCPEVREIIALFSSLTEFEYERLTKRAQKIAEKKMRKVRKLWLK